MNKRKDSGKSCDIQYIATPGAFLAAFVFFQFAYPYHLMRREQMNLFLFDGNYIRQTYRGTGWLVRFVSDFLEQFFHLPVVGPLVVALLLTAIVVVVYRICRHFLGKWPSLAVAALFFAWSFMRETGNLYITRYTLAVLGYLSLVLLALQFRKVWMRPIAAVLLLAFGVWALGSPIHKDYGKAWSVPKLEYERMIGLDAEVARENWDKVLKLSKVDLHMEEASYCYNLAHAMKGDLGDALFNHSQNHHSSLLFPVSGDQTVFTNGLAGEAWFHIGDMTVAEQSAITSLQASPHHTGTRFLLRLARVNLITGEDAAAQKYLNLLSRTLFYGKWARSMMPGRQDAATRAQLAKARTGLIAKDFVHLSNDPRSVLLSLLEADPENRVARNYLLCFDLLRYDLEEFIEDYVPDMIQGRLYHEAILIWLSQHDRLNEAEVARYGVDVSTVDRMIRFGRNPEGFRNSYWYYYLEAISGQ
jgi:hypothetical protein